MRTLLLILIPFVLIACAVYFASGAVWNTINQRTVNKEIAFDHSIHANLTGVTNCEPCHTYRQDGSFTGLPQIAVCLTCHTESSDAVNAELLKYKTTDVPWESHAKQTKKVFFSHKVVKTSVFDNGNNKMSCNFNVCHGKMGASDSYSGTKQLNRVECEDCHAALKISNRCMVCH